MPASRSFTILWLTKIRKDYPLTGVLKRVPKIVAHYDQYLYRYQEGLPAYWGIETLISVCADALSVAIASDQEGLPAYWGIETKQVLAVMTVSAVDQEGLPAYWGIETYIFRISRHVSNYIYQEGLPAYWGIETYL